MLRYRYYRHVRQHRDGALPDGPTDEVPGFVTGRFLVTVRGGPSALFDERRARLARRGANDRVDVARPVTVLYAVMDRLVDSFFPVLTTIDDRIDDLEDDILARPTQAQLGELFTLKRTLVQMRKVVGPERDLVASVLAGVGGLPGLGSGQERYFRDLYDHLIRIGDMVDGYRDLVSGVMDTHLSTVSNRLNVVMKQLAIIATIFLPLSFLTGFFGQNFSFLVAQIGGLPVFVGVGIGLEVIAVVLLLVMFKRRGWLGGPSA